jgi:hypothetical protein
MFINKFSLSLFIENLLDFTKGQELMKNLIKLFKENVNLKNHFKNLVNPNCSCTKSLELIVSNFFFLLFLKNEIFSEIRR